MIQDEIVSTLTQLILGMIDILTIRQKKGGFLFRQPPSFTYSPN